MIVNVLGSCVSRISLLDGDSSGHGIAHDEIEMEYIPDKQNITLSVMPLHFLKMKYWRFLPKSFVISHVSFPCINV
jgi:hypothetical protein